MIGVPSQPYNDLDNELYGGKARNRGLHRLARGIRKAWALTPVGYAVHRAIGRKGTRRVRGGGIDYDTGQVIGGGWGDYDDELFAGRVHRRRRRATAKQLRALAKGRAKLKALRRLKGGRVRRRYKSKRSSSFKDMDYGPTARMGSHPRYSQEGLDRAVLEMTRIYNKLHNEYGWGTNEPVNGPEIYPLAQKLNNMYNYVQRCEALGYTSAYPIPEMTPADMLTLRDYQEANNMSRALRRDGPNTLKSVVRKILEDNGQPHDPAAVNAAIRRGRIGIYDAETRLPGYNPNVF